MSLQRRLLELPAPEELRLLDAVAAKPVEAEPAWSKRLVWLRPEPEVRVTVTLVGGGLGERRSLRREIETKESVNTQIQTYSDESFPSSLLCFFNQIF